MKRKPVLLLLPGLLCDERVWRDQQAALGADHDCRVPDWGRRDSLQAMAEHALQCVPDGPFALAGHSMGGRVAFQVLRLAPDRVQRLALLDTGAEARAEGEAGEAERRKRLALLHKAREQGMRAMGREWARGMVHPDVLGTALFDDILDMIERKSPEVFEAQITALLARPDARGLLASARCPTLLLCGREDAWSPPAQHEALQRLLPSARLTLVAHCGHMSTMEQPQAVTQALADWLTW